MNEIQNLNSENDLHIANHIEQESLPAMILSALRMVGGESDSPIKEERSRIASGNPNNVILCSDEDYQIAELIGNKLILHMAQAYQMIKGTEKIEQPKIKPLDQKQILLSLLPEEFESKTLVEEAKTQGICRRTAFNWSEEWQQVGVIIKIRHGVFRKRLASA